MTERLNIISFCCNVSLNFAHYSEAKEINQIVLRKHINYLFNIAFTKIGFTNRIILATDNSVSIAYNGPPEAAMLVATDILNRLSVSNKHCSTTLSASIGIHLEPVRLLNDFNEHPNIIGNSIDKAKQLMCFAQPNEILVSPSYYENLTPTVQSQTTMFEQVCVKHENHVLDYQKYLANLMVEKVSKNEPIILDQQLSTKLPLQTPKKSAFLNTNSLNYVLACLSVVITVFFLIELSKSSNVATSARIKILPLKAPQSTNIKEPLVKPEISLQNDKVDNKSIESVQVGLEPIPSVKSTQSKKKIKQKTINRVDSTPTNSKNKEKISWESFKKSIKQGQKNECTQPEIALNQCH